MSRSTIEIKTEDGVCPASVFRSSGVGPWPAVIFYMDGIGIRPALFEMGERLARHGYFVLLPDLFYRAGAYVAQDPKTLFAEPEKRAAWLGTYMATAAQPNIMRDTRAFLDYLTTQPDVIQPRVGVTGYCMGGALALAAAGSYPDRVAAAASYHGANLATDAPTSPHLFAPKIKAHVYVGGASEDVHFPDAQKRRLEAALTDAGVRHTVETYDARHGWVPSDTPAHDAVAAEKHWQTLFALLDGALKS